MEEIEFLTLVKAYPAISKKYGEVSCVAGLRLDRPDARAEWIRLYPIPFRALDDEQRFRKYEPIRLEVVSHSGDNRPESRRPNRDSIRVSGTLLSTDHGWRARRPIVESMISGSMCELLRRQREDGTSLGMFRPREVMDVVIEDVDPDEEKRLAAEAWAAQASLFDGPDESGEMLRAIEQIPFRFKYDYVCGEPDCSGHNQSIIDWEIMQLYRRVRSYHDWRERVREVWLRKLCAADRDTAFIVGNQRLYPTSFLVLGVWWPPRQSEQLRLA